MMRFACLAGLAVALIVSSCNRDDTITTDSPPRILLDDASGVYTVKTGRELEIAPATNMPATPLFAGRRRDASSAPNRRCFTVPGASARPTSVLR